MSKLTISWIAIDSLFFVCSKKLSDSVNFRNYLPRIDQIPLRKLFLKFDQNRTTFFYIQKSCYLSLFTEWLTFSKIILPKKMILIRWFLIWIQPNYNFLTINKQLQARKICPDPPFILGVISVSIFQSGLERFL